MISDESAFSIGRFSVALLCGVLQESTGRMSVQTPSWAVEKLRGLRRSALSDVMRSKVKSGGCEVVRLQCGREISDQSERGTRRA